MHRLSATILSAILLAAVATAEIYQGIGPLDTLGDVKAKFPNAQFERLKPAWAQPADAMYSIEGSGISGTIIVKFVDPRPSNRVRLETETDEKLRKLLEQWVSQSDQEALQVEWVRWIPLEPLPLKRFVAKYGDPDRSGFRDDDMRPYRLWLRGIHATLDDDVKNVVSVEFSFTDDDERAAYKEKFGFIPDFLKGTSKPTIPAAKAPKKKRAA